MHLRKIVFHVMSAGCFCGSSALASDTSPTPHTGVYGPDTAGLHIEWATAAEAHPPPGNPCHHMNTYKTTLKNMSEADLYFVWEDAGLMAFKPYPLRAQMVAGSSIPTKAPEFDLIDDSSIQLGQGRNYVAKGATYKPNEPSKPDCGQESVGLNATLEHSYIDADEKEQTARVKLGSSIVIGESGGPFINHTMQIDGMEGAILAHSGIAALVSGSAEGEEAAFEGMKMQLADFQTEAYLGYLLDQSDPELAGSIPGRFTEKEFAFVRPPNGKMISFSFSLPMQTEGFTDEIFEVVLLDADKQIVTSGLVASWMPAEQ